MNMPNFASCHHWIRCSCRGGAPDDGSVFRWPPCENAKGAAVANPAVVAMNFKYSRLEVPLSLMMFAASARIRFGTCGKRLYSVDQVLRSCLPATYLRARGLTVVQAVLQYKLMQSEPQQDSVGISRGLLKE